MEISNNKTEITFTNSNSAIKAKEIATQVIASVEDKYLYLNGIKNTIKKLSVKDNALIIPEGEGELTTYDLLEIMTDVVKAIATQLPSESFSLDIDGLDTYSEGWLVGKYENGTLVINSTYYPSGYTEYLCCPKCGEHALLISDYDPNKKCTCPECGEEIDLSEEYNECAPIIETKIIKIA